MTRERVVLAIEAAEGSSGPSLVERARRRGFSRFVVRSPEEIASLAGEEIWVRREDRLIGPEPASVPIPIRTVATEADLTRALADAPPDRPILIELPHDRVIPLENAIAGRGRASRPWVFANGPREVPGALGALEHGAGRVVVRVRTPEEVDAIEAVLEADPGTPLEWRTVGLTAVRPAGIGDRVLVDTTSLLRPDEGLLVGSVAAFLFHVASEAEGSKFSRARPFRVNAGAAHSYVLMADGTTRYLSELVAGDRVLATVPRGPSRPVRVGRIKIERRPLIVLEADDNGRARTIFLQEAETVRISTDAGRRSTAEIGLPARAFGVALAEARHLGQSIEETIVER